MRYDIGYSEPLLLYPDVAREIASGRAGDRNSRTPAVRTIWVAARQVLNVLAGSLGWFRPAS